MTADTAIATHGLTKRFGAVLALDRLDLAVPRGTVYGFLGPNGAGKTTTLRLLAGLARPSGGGTHVTGRLGYLAQEPQLYAWMTGRELLEFVLDLRGGGTAPRRGTRRARIDETLDLTGLRAVADRRIGGYSGGMRQRIGLAAALVDEPDVLLLDEPVSSLDPVGRHDLLETIGRLRERATVLFSTHILADVERVCDRVGILDHGRLVAEGPIDVLLERYAGDAFRVVTEPGETTAIAELTATLEGQPWVRSLQPMDDERGLIVRVVDARLAAPALVRVIADQRLVLDSFERVRPTLEDVFLRVVGSDERVAS